MKACCNIDNGWGKLRGIYTEGNFAVVMASVLYQAANSNEPLAPNVLPTQPRVTDPFAYPDPSKKP